MLFYAKVTTISFLIFIIAGMLYPSEYIFLGNAVDTYKRDNYLSQTFSCKDSVLSLTIPASDNYPQLLLEKAYEGRFFIEYNYSIEKRDNILSAFRHNFFSLNFNQASGPSKHDGTIINDYLVVDKDSTSLEIVYRSGLDSTNVKFIKFQIDSRHHNNISKEINFFSNDSVEISIFSNGKSKGKIRAKTFFSPERRLLVFMPFPLNTVTSMKISGLQMLSHKRLPVPMSPIDCLEEKKANGITLSCAPYNTLNETEQIVSTEWEIFQEQDTLPLFAEKTTTAGLLYRFDIKFDLVPGSYFWRVRYVNNSDNPGHFSEKRSFTVQDSLRKKRAEITNVEFMSSTINKKVNVLNTDEWYNLRVTLTQGSVLKELGYLILGVNHPDYPFGNPGNKYGKFIDSLNYVLNFSFHDKNVYLHEKSRANSYSSVRVPDTSNGLYVSLDKDRAVFDSVSGTINVRFRLLKNAKPGLWKVSAYCVSSPEENVNGRDELYSAIYRRDIAVQTKEKTNYFILFALAGVSALFVTLVFVQKRRKNSIKSNKLVAYLIENLHREEVSKELATQELKLSRQEFYELIKNSGSESFPALLNLLRMQKAAEMLKAGVKSVNEIAYEVGFSDAGYFIKVFKKSEGLTPVEFRDKNRI